MIQTPSKYLGRTFLKRLAENNFVTESGLEYCGPEVTDLLITKEVKQAEIDFRREMRKRSANIDHVTSIKNFQEAMFATIQPGIIRGPKNIGQVETRCSEFKADTIFLLNELPSKDSISPPAKKNTRVTGKPDVMSPAPVTRTRMGSKRLTKPPKAASAGLTKGGAMKKNYMGYPVLSVSDYSKSQIRRDIEHHEKTMQRIGEASAHIGAKSSKGSSRKG